ncbi:MAG TPA: ABC transporter ATP-binding protein [Motilibacteraceae bacterium]|nr:ABC transporter ATP-binding protein [Motilibacteraceae bacterium]
MHASVVLRAQGLRKVYGDVVALAGADLEIRAGEVRGLVGPNGAGKTTLLGMLLGLTCPDAGELVVLGERVRRGVTPRGVSGFVDTPTMYPALSARANVAMLASLTGPVDPRRVDDALERVGLADVAADRARGFSLGMRQRLGLAVALLARPRLLVLDEPANGLDPAGTDHVHRVIEELAAAGTSVLLSSHRMDELSALCRTITVLHQGDVAFDGTVSDLAASAGPREYRLAVDDVARARALLAAVDGPSLVRDADDRGALTVRGDVASLDRLVAALVSDGVAVRELTPVRSALEVAFLELTGAAPAAPQATRFPAAVPA